MQAGFNVLGFFVPNVNINASVPKSYIVYRFYDKNGVLLSRDFRLLSSASNGAWENLQIPTFEANTNGNLEVFVFNESNVNVWFDDMQIQHIPTLISQENHYYAFGMNAKEIEKEGNVNNRFQYNKMAEKNEFMGLDWYDTKYRNLDTEIARWLQVDPKADEGHLSSLTPYNSMDNNPIRYNDPDGDCPFCPFLINAGKAMIKELVVQTVTNVIIGVGTGDPKKILDIDVFKIGAEGVKGLVFADGLVGNGITALVKSTTDYKPIANGLESLDNAPNSIFLGTKKMENVVVDFIAGPGGNGVGAVAKELSEQTIKNSIKTTKDLFKKTKPYSKELKNKQIELEKTLSVKPEKVKFVASVAASVASERFKATDHSVKWDNLMSEKTKMKTDNTRTNKKEILR